MNVLPIAYDIAPATSGLKGHVFSLASELATAWHLTDFHLDDPSELSFMAGP